MANIVWDANFKMRLDLTQEDLGQGIEGLWDLIYGADRVYAARNVPASGCDPLLRCFGCRLLRVHWVSLRRP